MRKNGILSVGLVFIFQLQAGSAQNASTVDPGAVRERARITEEYYRLEKRLREPKEPGTGQVDDATKEETQPEPGNADQKIFVRAFETNHSRILSDIEIRQITGPYEGRHISIRNLFDIVREFNKLYAAKRFLAAQAVLPPQKVEKGIVRIELVESTVGDILVEDNEHSRDSYYVRRISLKAGDLVRLDQLEKDIRFFNSTNDVAMRAELRAGEALRTTDCVIKVREPERYQAAFYSDNAGRDSVGLYRFGMMFESSSLFGHTDRLMLNAFSSGNYGTVAGSVSYNLPVTTRGTRLNLSYDHNQIQVVSGPYQVLNIGGGSSDMGIDISQPFIINSALKLGAFAGIHASNSKTDFDGATLFTHRVRSLNTGFDIQALDEGGSWYSQVKLTKGFHAFGANNSFTKYSLFVSRQQILGDSVVLVFRGRGQVGGNLLPPSEQFQIGGSSSVRGYSEGFLTGDKGYVFSGEASFPLRLTGLTNRLKGIVFVDHGGTFPYKGQGDSTGYNDYLTGAGFGFMASVSKRLVGRLSVGFPVSGRNRVEDKYQIHFHLQSTLF